MFRRDVVWFIVVLHSEQKGSLGIIEKRGNLLKLGNFRVITVFILVYCSEFAFYCSFCFFENVVIRGIVAKLLQKLTELRVLHLLFIVYRTMAGVREDE